jgi:hypothetical protein
MSKNTVKIEGKRVPVVTYKGEQWVYLKDLMPIRGYSPTSHGNYSPKCSKVRAIKPGVGAIKKAIKVKDADSFLRLLAGGSQQPTGFQKFLGMFGIK